VTDAGANAAAAHERSASAEQTAQKVQEDVKSLHAQVDELVGRFDGLDRRVQDRQKKDDDNAKKLEELALRAANDQAAGRGKLDDLGATIDQINKKLAEINAKPAAAAPPAPAAPAPRAKAVRLKPGDRVEVLHRGTSVVGNLVSVNGEKIDLMIIDGTRPKTIDMREVTAIQTRDGIFALNRETGAFESAVTFYRLNTASGVFEKVDATENVYQTKDVVIENGPGQFARALWAIGAGGMCIGLPMPPYQSPPSIDAKYLKTMVTTQGEFTYNEEKRDYDFRSHQDRAMAAKAAKDQFWKEREEQRYKRLMEGYEAGTRRLQALAPLWWRRWWWW
jgi:hypothetical protein